MADVAGERRACLIGTGLIGGSIGLGLRAQGWHVSGVDRDAATQARALDRGAIDATGIDPAAAITFVAAPVQQVADLVRRALAETAGAVTDVGSVKAGIVDEIDDPRFVGGHPMAGSEQLGIDGSAAELFEGAVWVLTPVAGTDADAHQLVRSVVRSLGADVVELPPERHDALVAVVSHVPHLTAAALMTIADERADEHAALLRLAAGGFRDMTRIAAGTPTIWPDICAENRVAILDAIDQVRGQLDHLRSLVEVGDRGGLLEVLERAQGARRNLPGRAVQPEALAELRVPILDRPGGIAEVSTLAAELGVNISDLEIAHSSEGERGVLILVVDRDGAEPLRAGLAALGYRPMVAPLR
ncbi:MAG: prephenate dehydrogenase/arogenate dehydrogenase family protein [Acidimicrobiales bacterium]|nr:prephenate dehydrogenase/arogenate dehydrogenase family protein [Acidimicrobiales bacterium]HRW39206.1 prephenate dehydrogenase/arogenate dehydrogenase family protein [Aquihabitans sp.]